MTDMILSTDGEEKFRIPSPFSNNYYVVTKCPTHKLEIKKRKMTSKETIQQLKEDITLLQMKLQKLEEMEKHKSPVEEAYKRVYGNYPDTGICNGMSYVWWDVFCKGYNASKEECKVEEKPTPQEQENNEWRNVALRFGEELVSIGPCGYYDMTANDWLEWAKGAYEKNSDDLLKFMREKQRKCEALTEKLQEKTVIEPTSQTPEQVEQGLRDAMKKAKEDGVFDEPKTETLHEIILKWCDDDNQPTCDVLVDMIKEWLPDELEYDGEEYHLGWNDAIRTTKDKLK